MEKNIALEKALQEAVDKAEVGTKVNITMSGDPVITSVEMIFKGGWVVNQDILPGKSLELTKGEDGYLETINITLKNFDGLQSA